MSKWSEKFNLLPKEIRNISAMCETEMRINQLEMEKDRLKKAYISSLRLVNDHIKNLQDFLKKEDKPASGHALQNNIALQEGKA